MNHLDLFSGIGGFALAAKWAGINTVAFCEIDPYCQKVLKKNFPTIPICKDIKKLKRSDIDGTIELVTGGFPCQPFSVAGRKKGTEDDRDLWPQMFRVIKEFKPTWVIGENVAHFVNMAFQRTKTDLESEGYEVQPFIIPACGVNAPHKRDRVWIVAYASGQRLQGSKCIRNSQEKTGTGREGAHGTTPQCCDDAPNPQSIGLPRGDMPDDPRDKSENQQGRYQGRGEVEQHLRQWEFEPNVGRVAHGISNRVGRIKGLGNAIVPQVAYQIMKGINNAPS